MNDTVVQLLGKVQELSSLVNGGSMKLQEIQNMENQIADFENAIKVLKENRDKAKKEIEEMEETAQLIKAQSDDLLYFAHKEFSDLRTKIDETLSSPIAPDKIGEVVEMLSRENDLLKSLNVAEDRLGEPKTPMVERRISSGISKTAEICDL